MKTFITILFSSKDKSASRQNVTRTLLNVYADRTDQSKNLTDHKTEIQN